MLSSMHCTMKLSVSGCTGLEQNENAPVQIHKARVDFYRGADMDIVRAMDNFRVVTNISCTVS